jgi:hypothetical protein
MLVGLLEQGVDVGRPVNKEWMLVGLLEQGVDVGRPVGTRSGCFIRSCAC